MTAYYADPCIGLTGGLDGYLDAIDGSVLSDKCFAITVTNDGLYIHQLDEDSALAESSPDVIKPDTNAGDKRWIRRFSMFGNGTEGAPCLTFDSDPDCGIYRIGADDFAVTVGGEAVLRFKRSGGMTYMGHPDNFTGEAPFFRVSEVFSTPAIEGQNLLLTGEADTCDLALRRVNGTGASPTKVLTEQWCGQLYWWPYDGTGYNPGSIYGAAINSDWYDSEPGANNAGPYNFVVDLNEAAPSDIAVFVEAAASTNMQPANLKTKTTGYTFTYDNVTKALAITFTAGNEPAIGNTIWAFRRFDWSGTAPFYGRQGCIKVIGSQEPSQTARGAVMTFEITKNNQVVARPRMWLNGTSGNLIVAGKAVHEGDTAGAGKYYPDRVNTSGGPKNGCPSGIDPITWTGKGNITIPAIDIAVDAAIAIRSITNSQNGWDIGWDSASGELRIYTVAADSRTSRWQLGSTGTLTATATDQLKSTGLVRLVERGDPAAVDKAVGDFTTDDTWRDLDLSAIVPAGAIAIVLNLQIQDDAAASQFRFRKNGNSNEHVYDGLRTHVAGVTNEKLCTVFCDSGRVIEYKGSNLAFTIINVTVAGWYLAP